MARRRPPRPGWTAADIPDLAGRTDIVTGANSGLGFVTASELAGHGASVTLAVRDLGRSKAAQNGADARCLWEESERLTGVRYALG